MDKPDLSLVSNEDLMRELAGRHDGLLVIRVQNRGTGEITTPAYFGGYVRAMGMARYAVLYLDMLTKASLSPDCPQPRVPPGTLTEAEP